jgi:hypothetical protein
MYIAESPTSTDAWLLVLYCKAAKHNRFAEL